MWINIWNISLFVWVINKTLANLVVKEMGFQQTCGKVNKTVDNVDNFVHNCGFCGKVCGNQL